MEMLYVSCVFLFSLPLVPVPVDVPSGTSPSQRGMCSTWVDRPTLAWTLTHQSNTIRLFCATFASHKIQQTPIMAPLRMEDAFVNLCKRHRKGEIYRATSLSELITDLSYHLYTISESPTQFSSLCRSMLWPTVSNAPLRSSSTSTDILPVSELRPEVERNYIR